MKYHLELTTEVLEKLNSLRTNGETKKIRQKASAIYLRAIGKNIPFIMVAAKLSNKTIISHVKAFIKQGINYIFENNYNGNNVSELDKFEEIILSDFAENPPSTIREATSRIEKLTAIKRSGTQVRTWLKKRGFLTKKQEVYQQKQIKKSKRNF